MNTSPSSVKVHLITATDLGTLIVFYSDAHCWQFRVLSSAGEILGLGKIFIPLSHLSIDFLKLISLMNQMRCAIPDTSYSEDFLFSSAYSDGRAILKISILRQGRVSVPLRGLSQWKAPSETLAERGFYRGFSQTSFSPSFQPHLLKPILIY